MKRSLIITGFTLVGHLYLPVLRCIDGAGVHDQFSFGVVRVVAALIPLLAILVVVGWHQSWLGCCALAGSMAASTVALYWMLEWVGLATSNQPVDGGSWYLYLFTFVVAYGVPLAATRGARAAFSIVQRDSKQLS
jgi:hypothetical protein